MLTQADTRLLAFEEAHPRRTALKIDLILTDLKMPHAAYQRRLRALAVQPEAVAAFPRVCHRVQRTADRTRLQREGLQRMLEDPLGARLG